MGKSILISYLIGLPIGILFIIVTLLFPIVFTGEVLFSMVFAEVFGLPTIGLVLSFLIALGIGGTLVYKNLKKDKSTIKVSFIYSFIVNFIIWTVFGILTLLTNGGDFLMLLLPVLAFLLCTLLTTISIGLLVVKVTKSVVFKI